MTEQSSTSEFESLSDRAIVYRALLRKNWIDRETEEINAEAYLLRKEKNELGLSVRIASACSLAECAARFRKCYGIASLEVGPIRELGLEVVPDSPSHAQIIGLPNLEDDARRALELADLLAQQSLLVWQA